MADMKKYQTLVMWGLIEDYYSELFQLCMNLKTLNTPEIKKDYYEFRRVMRESINDAGDPGRLGLQAIFKKLPGNKWVPILVHIAHRGKANIKPVNEMNEDERAEYFREGDKFMQEVNNQAEKLARGDVSGAH